MRSSAPLALAAGALVTGACATLPGDTVHRGAAHRSHVLASCAEHNPLQTANTASTYEVLEDQGFTGAVVVLDGTEVSFCRATGLAGSGVDHTAGLPADVGSISKPATALAILALAEQGKLDLDERLAKWFDEVPSDKADITIRQLLLHQAGLPEYIPDTEDYTVISQSDAVRAIFSLPLAFSPGSEWGYSNSGFTLLAALVERSSGRPYFEAMDQLVFAPAGVQASYDPAQFRKVTNVRRREEWTDLRRTATPAAGPFWALWGAGGLYMSAADLALFMRAFMEGRIVSNAVVEQARVPLVPLNETNAGSLAFGLVKRHGEWVYYFNGMGESGSADVWGDPDTGRVLAVTANSAKPHAIAAGRKLAGVALDSMPVEASDTEVQN